MEFLNNAFHEDNEEDDFSLNAAGLGDFEAINLNFQDVIQSIDLQSSKYHF